MRSFYGALVLIALITATIARGGETTAVVTGVITQGGAPAAHVRVTSDDGVAITNERGEYRLLVTPGHRHIAVNQNWRDFDIAPGETARFDLDAGVIPELSPPAPVHDSEHATVELPLAEHDLASLPLDRIVNDVFRTAPGSVQTIFGRTILGTPRGGNGVLIDGVELPEETPVQLPLEFFEAVNLLTIGTPAEYGHSTGGLLLATTPSQRRFRAGVFAYYQPTASSTHNSESTKFRSWDAGFTIGGAPHERLWLFAGYDRADAEATFSSFGGQHFHDSLNAFLGKVELTATPSAKVIVEAFGDPGRESFDVPSFISGSNHIGTKAAALRTIVNGSTWLVEGGASRVSLPDVSFYDTHTGRAYAGVQRMFGAHVLRGGGEYADEAGQLRLPVIVIPPSGAHTTGAAYIADTWQPRPGLVVDGGLRREWLRGGNYSSHQDFVWLPRASVIWQSSQDFRLFTTFGRYADDLMLGAQPLPNRMSEATAGADFSLDTVQIAARLIRRTIAGRNMNGGLLELRRQEAALRLHLFYLLSSLEPNYGEVFAPTARRRHQVTGTASANLGIVDAGTIVTWSSSASLPRTTERAPSLFRTDLHLGVTLRAVSLVADVFNLFNRQTPYGFTSEFDLPSFPFPIPFPLPNQPIAWESPRAIRFGIRAAL